MASNPLGAVIIADGGNPRTLTGIALETISGGQCVVASGAFNAVGSQAASFDTSDIKVALVIDPEKVNGVALNNATSGNAITFATRGAVILKTLGSVLQGNAVEAVSHEGVQSISSGAIPSALYAGIMASKSFGRALTAAGSNQYALIDIHP
jgi:hypothetical protein